MSVSGLDQRLRRGDYLLLALFALCLFGYTVIAGGVLSGHSAVIPQSAREMQVHHDWLVPTCGGLPWLERPPLPHWIMVALGSVFGDEAYDVLSRCTAVAMALVVVWLTAWMAALWYGRAVGMVSGLILATMWEFFGYAGNPEADIFLCAIVTGAVALFVALEFGRGPARAGDGTAFLGRRSWIVLAFFVVLGMTNLAKGLVFGTLMVLIPIGGFLLLAADFQAIRRYLWLWGWLAFAVVWLAWPLAVYQRYPDVMALWFSDYLGRLNGGHVAEPRWYYLAALPWVTAPWPLAALLGLWLTRKQALRERRSPARFLWIWAVLTPAVFSIPDGKHHHYLLQCLAPWAVLAAVAAVRSWQALLQWPAWLRHPVVGLLVVGVPADLALWLLRTRIPGPPWIVPLMMVVVPLSGSGLYWASSRPRGRLAAAAFFSILAALYCLGHAYQTRYVDGYREETVFLQEVSRMVPAGEPLFVHFDVTYPLETFRLLFYVHHQTMLLHNATFLSDERIGQNTIYVLGRLADQEQFARYGTTEVVLQSACQRGVSTPAQRRVLFRLHFYEGMVRHSARVRVSPMQAVHREVGPFLQ
jgi:4-amino-4-deoxy-L-arabinose transferase-like glycosyltransferase